MSYWRLVLTRATHEVLATLRWESPLRVLLSVGPTIGGGALTFLATRNFAWSALGSLGLIAGVACGVLVLRILQVPPSMAREAAEAAAERAQELQSELALARTPPPREGGGTTLYQDGRQVALIRSITVTADAVKTLELHETEAFDIDRLVASGDELLVITDFVRGPETLMIISEGTFHRAATAAVVVVGSLQALRNW